MSRPTELAEFTPSTPDVEVAPPPVSGPRRSLRPGDRTYLAAASVGENQTHWSAATAEEREAILASLYRERSELLRARRLQGPDVVDEGYLAELERYIDDWEVVEGEAASPTEVWQELGRLAADVLTVHARIEGSRRK